MHTREKRQKEENEKEKGIFSHKIGPVRPTKDTHILAWFACPRPLPPPQAERAEFSSLHSRFYFPGLFWPPMRWRAWPYWKCRQRYLTAYCRQLHWWCRVWRCWWLRWYHGWCADILHSLQTNRWGGEMGLLLLYFLATSRSACVVRGKKADNSNMNMLCDKEFAWGCTRAWHMFGFSGRSRKVPYQFSIGFVNWASRSAVCWCACPREVVALLVAVLMQFVGLQLVV